MRGESGWRGADQPSGLACALFDLDGTVADTLDLIRGSLRHATRTVLGAALPDEILMRNVGVPLAAQMREFDPHRVEELLAAYRAHNERWHDMLIKEYPGVREGLDILARSGLRLGIVTSKLRHGALRALSSLGLAHLFEVVIGADDVERHKPDPTPLLTAAERLAVEPSLCAYIGDSHHDMTAACRAGMLPIGVLWGVSDRDRLEAAGARHIARDMTDVINIVSRRSAAEGAAGCPSCGTMHVGGGSR